MPLKSDFNRSTMVRLCLEGLCQMMSAHECANGEPELISSFVVPVSL